MIFLLMILNHNKDNKIKKKILRNLNRIFVRFKYTDKKEIDRFLLKIY
jgi:hypothetical protein